MRAPFLQSSPDRRSLPSGRPLLRLLILMLEGGVSVRVRVRVRVGVRVRVRFSANF